MQASRIVPAPLSSLKKVQGNWGDRKAEAPSSVRPALGECGCHQVSNLRKPAEIRKEFGRGWSQAELLQRGRGRHCRRGVGLSRDRGPQGRGESLGCSDGGVQTTGHGNFLKQLRDSDLVSCCRGQQQRFCVGFFFFFFLIKGVFSSHQALRLSWRKVRQKDKKKIQRDYEG